MKPLPRNGGRLFSLLDIWYAALFSYDSAATLEARFVNHNDEFALNNGSTVFHLGWEHPSGTNQERLWPLLVALIQ
jgi:hypothetical protein